MSLKTSPGPGDIVTILSRLTDRDMKIIDVLGRHRCLTLTQIVLLFFGSSRAARDRLSVLLDLDIVARFRTRQGTGSQPYRYTLGLAGAYLHTAATDQPAPKTATINRAIAQLAASQQLPHLLRVNDFAARLHHAAAGAGVTVRAWLSGAEASAATGGQVRPDAGFTLSLPDGTDAGVWFEHDTGTRTLGSLATQIRRYGHLPGHARRGVLVELHSPIREDNLHHALATTTEARAAVTAATTHTGISTDPTTAIWRRIGTAARLHLADVTDSTPKK